MHGMRLGLCLVALLPLLSACAAARPTVAAEPELARGLATADSLVSAAIGHLTAGAVLVVTKNGRVVKETAYGHAHLNDYAGRPLGAPVPMQVSTVFDLASVTKVMATTYALMLLVEGGKVNLDAPVYRYLPEFRGVHLDSILVRHLLTHSAGLVQWQPLYYQAGYAADTYRAIRQMPLQWGVGKERHYSDLSFMLAGYIVEQVSGDRLDDFLTNMLYRPLRLRSTGFNPLTRGITNIAATEQGNVYEKHMVYDSTFGYRYRGDPTKWNGWREYVLKGEVDDGNSWYAHGGVAGHAGLFSNARELSVLLEVLLGRGLYDGRRVISLSTLDRFFTRDAFGHYMGWQYQSFLPAGSFAHTGFTGTYVAGVPSQRLGVVLLTNRQQMGPDARGYFPNLAPLQEAVMRALVR